MFTKVAAAVLLLLAFFHESNAIPIDNGVEGEPEISCGPASITINFNTRNPWNGQLYVKNFYDPDGECVVKGDGSRLGSIELGFDQCGVQRERSLEPRGVFVWVTVVMSFHEKFLTKVDRAVRAQCFYMEADKTVSQEIEVSMLTTELATFNVPMPVCRYDIRESSAIDSEPVSFAIVGQSVWHHWICETDYPDTFCSYPYGCFVTDGSGEESEVVQLLDDDGCYIDLNLLAQPEYTEDLWARVESHVFKYADRPNLYFNCQMHVTIKEPGQECPKPQCSRRRSKRSASQAFIADVSVPKPILVADLDFTEEDLRRTKNAFGLVPAPFPPTHQQPTTEGICVGAAGLGLMFTVGVLLVLATIVSGFMLCSNRRKD